MNNSVQAQKGFKTFLLTLSISLIVFSVIYYIITSTTSNTAMDLSPNIESDSTAMVSQDDSGEVAGVSSDRSSGVDSSAPTAFGALAAQKIDVPQRQVLGGAVTAQTTQSTTAVPDGGSFEITMGLLFSTLAFVLGMTLVAKDPRKMALNGFEQDFIREL